MDTESFIIRKLVSLFGLIGMAFGIGGCAKAPNYEQTITNLKREVTRLKAERANLDARSTVLDDKVLVLEKKLQKCDETGKTQLTVVKLKPDDLEPDWEERPVAITPEEKWSDNGNRRPKLILKNTSRRRRPFAPNTTQEKSASMNTNQFDHLDADNLGVTPKSDQPVDAASENGVMEAFNAAYRAYSNKQYSVALQGFAGFVNGHPTHAYADNAIFWRGECYLAMGKLANAIGEYQRLKRRYPRSEKVAASVYKVGMIYDKMRDFGKAADYYFEVVEHYPGTDEARRASRRVAEIRNRNGNVTGLLPTSVKR